MSKMYFLPFRPAFDSAGVSVSGSQHWFTITGTNTPSAPFADAGLTTHLENPVVSDGVGYLPPIYLDDDVTYRVRVYLPNAEVGVDTPIEEYDPYIPGTFILEKLGLGGIAGASSRAQIAALSSSAASAYLMESGREGVFIWDGANHSAHVTVDTTQGIYIAPATDTTGASGAWVRKFDGPILPQWFGCVADDDNRTGTDNSSAWAAMEAVLVARSSPENSNTIYQGAKDEILVVGRFYLGSHTIEPLTTMKMRGIGGVGAGCPSRLRFAANTTALRAQSYNTSGDATTGVPNHMSGDYWTIEDIYFLGGSNLSSATEGNYHGCHAKRPIRLLRCTFDSFQGDGFYNEGDAAGGIADVSLIEGCRFTNCRNGRFSIGADSNVCAFINNQYLANRRWGVLESSFLGNYEFGAQSADNGIVGTLTTFTVVSYSGNRYAVIDGQESGASTNAPSGTTADNAYWYYIGVGGVASTIPAWVSGVSLRSGGAYCTTSIDATNGFFGCYSEGGQGPSQFVSPTEVFGGTHSAQVKGSPGYINTFGGQVIIGNGVQGAAINGNFQWNAKSGTAYSLSGFSNSADVNLDLKTGNVANQINAYNSDGSPAGYMAWISGHYYLNNQNSSGQVHFRIAGSDIVNVSNTGMDIQSGKVLSVAGTQVVKARQTGWVADTGTASRATHATYAAGTTLTFSASYVQSEHTALATRLASVEAALQAATQSQKALKDDLIAHGMIGT